VDASRKENRQSLEEEFNRFVFDLYLISSRVRLDEFRPEAFRLLDRLLPIDSAWWGNGLLKKRRFVVAQASFYNLGPDFFSDYRKLVDEDPLVEMVDDMGNGTLAWNGGGEVGSAAMNEFDRKYGLHCGMISMKKDPVSGVGMFLSVFRNEKSPEFTEADRLLMESVGPHLVQAWSINLRLALASESSSHIPDACLIDMDGRIIEISSAFVNKLHAEFPEWSGDILPHKLLGLFGQDRTNFFRGKTVNIWSEKNSEGQIRLQCGPGQQSTLTPREEAVAIAFSKGSSYKEIATSLNLSPGTVRSYLTQCYAKLDVKNKIELGNALGKK
jgi:DNA-binding CsgD family transcriptional regulator